MLVGKSGVGGCTGGVVHCINWAGPGGVEGVWLVPAETVAVVATSGGGGMAIFVSGFAVERKGLSSIALAAPGVIGVDTEDGEFLPLRVGTFCCR